MAEPALCERQGGIFAIVAVVDNFSGRLLRNPKIADANPELHEWHTVTHRARMPGMTDAAAPDLFRIASEPTVNEAVT